MLQGLMVVYGFIIVLTNLITDLTYGFSDPRGEVFHEGKSSKRLEIILIRTRLCLQAE